MSKKYTLLPSTSHHLMIEAQRLDVSPSMLLDFYATFCLVVCPQVPSLQEALESIFPKFVASCKLSKPDSGFAGSPDC